MVVFNWVKQGKELCCYVDGHCVGYVVKLVMGYPVMVVMYLNHTYIPAIVQYGTTFNWIDAQSMLQQMYIAYTKGLLNGYLNGYEKWVSTVGYRIAQHGMYMTCYKEGEYKGISPQITGYGIY